MLFVDIERLKKFQIPDVKHFVDVLVSYRKDDIVTIGTRLLWKAFINVNDSSERILIISYAPKIIALALATANNVAAWRIMKERDFIFLCREFWNIKETISDPEIIKEETQAIKKTLINKIPIQYLKDEFIEKSCSELFFSRLIREQSYSMQDGIRSLVSTYKVIQNIAANHDKNFLEKFKSTFGVEPIFFVRSTVLILASGLQNGGIIHINGTKLHSTVTEKFGIDVNSCKFAISQISCDESILKTWYNKEVCGTKPIYQKYILNPLSKSPIVHTNKALNKYIIPSPFFYFSAIRESIFSTLISKNVIDGNDIGAAIENYLNSILEKIFGKNNVTKFPRGKTKTADFIVDLPSCNLVIECKTTIGGLSRLSRMSHYDAAKIWSDLYEHCKQCSETIKKIKNNKPAVPIIIVGDDVIRGAAFPFQSLGIRSKLFSDLGIKFVEFFSFEDLQLFLSKTSVEKFEQELLKRQNQIEKAGNILSFDFEPDKPAHSYEFSSETEVELLGESSSAFLQKRFFL